MKACAGYSGVWRSGRRASKSLTFWPDAEGAGAIERMPHVDRKTVRRYVTTTQELGVGP